MTIQKIWLSRDTGKKSLYAGRTLGGVLGIVALMVVLILGGVLLTFFFDLPREVFTLLLCLGVTALGVVLGLRLGRRTVSDATIFFLASGDHLYGLQVSDHAWFGGSPLGYASGALETQRLLRELAARPYLPAAAEEILCVENIRKSGTEYAVRCRVRRAGEKATGKTFFIAADFPEIDRLLFELERRRGGEELLEITENPNPAGILVSAVALAIFSVLCVLSHPAQGKLPQEIYFPCLAAAFVAFGALVTFLVRRSRGE